MLIGWSSFVLLPLSFVNLDQVGAIIVCTAIVAEVFHEKKHRLFIDQILPGTKQSFMYKEVHTPEEDGLFIEITPHALQAGSSKVNTKDWTVYHLANDSEFMKYEETRIWNLEITTKRLETHIDYAIVGTAVVGTLLWAFG